MVFHSVLTTNGQYDGDIFEIYQDIGDMLKKGYLTDIISSTNKEADHAANLFDTDHSYAIPVTFVKKDIIPVAFASRKTYSLNAVARLGNVTDFLWLWGCRNGAKLKDLVKKLQAENYILFGGFKQDLTDVYNNAWLEALTSQYERFAMSLLEAQEHGCPAVSYDINYGPNEIITNNYNGRLIQAGDETALFDTMDLLLSHPSMIEEYSKMLTKVDKNIVLTTLLMRGIISCN